MENCPVIEINNLSFTYGCHPVLRDISLAITAGEVVGITGPNGSGKTTLIRLMMGQIQPQSGDIRIFGHPASSGGWRRRVSYIPQRAAHFNQGFPATVMEVVLSGRTGRKGLFRGFGPEDYRAAENALRIMEMDNLKDVPASSLSGGQQQRAFIARALAADPDLLVMDEPTVGVDPAASRKLYAILKKINSEKNMTLVIVSHDQEGISGLITRQVCLNLHLCTCNNWESAVSGVTGGNCAGLFSVPLNGRI
ncbi:MAG: metal ABC transporter ATP-binding protein [Peptococcaceae bacterium]|nr:metal ABC transporter ATP-binding protein [Peptococcaceae bacterium]